MNLKTTPQHLLKHPTKREGLYKFLMLFSVLLVYFGYLSWEYGLATGGLVAALTWSFFVLCTPVADAGFLLDVMSHKERNFHHAHGFKYKIIAMGGLLLIIVFAYYHLIAGLGVEIPQL